MGTKLTPKPKQHIGSKGTGPEAKIVGLRNRKVSHSSNEANNEKLSWVADSALTGLMATYYGDDTPAIQQRSEDIAGMLRYGPHHAKHPSELLGVCLRISF